MVQMQRLFYVVTCNADKAREAEAARMWQRSFRGASSSFTTRSTFRDTIQASYLFSKYLTNMLFFCNYFNPKDNSVPTP